MSYSLDDAIEFMISRRLTIEQSYMEIMRWPAEMQEEGKRALHEKMKEGRFDVAIKYHNTTILPPKDPKAVTVVSPRYTPVKKVSWFKRIFNIKKWFEQRKNRKPQH